MKKKSFLAATFALILGYTTIAQQVSTTTGQPINNLVDTQLGNSCIQVSNINSPNNSSVPMGFESIAGFDRNGTAFPFNSGIVLSTGRAGEVGSGSTTADLSSGNSSWTGDTDLENAIGISSTLNASVLEFDFTSSTNQVSFNYILASEEYQQDFPCNVSDAFAILIKPAAGGSYRNIAILPSGTPVQVQTIHPRIVGQCPAENEDFFAGYSIGETNFQGRTVPLTAIANVTPGIAYHLKMVIADDVDERFDSAVFIEGQSLNSSIDLGDELQSCTPLVLDASVGNSNAVYSWFLDNNSLPTSTSSITAGQSGIYRVEVSINDGSTTCTIIETVDVEINPNFLAVEVEDVQSCDPSGAATSKIFDLGATGADIMDTLGPGNYAIDFYASAADLANEVNALPASYRNTSNPQTIHVQVKNLDTGCTGTNTFELIIDGSLSGGDVNYEVCQDVTGLPAIDLENITPDVTNLGAAADVVYYENVADAQNEVNPLGSPFQLLTDTTVIYARIDDAEVDCFAVSTVTITTEQRFALLEYESYIDACDGDRDGFAMFDLTTRNNDFIAPGQASSISYHRSRLSAEVGSSPLTNVQSYRNEDRSVQEIFVRIEPADGSCPGIAVLTLYTNYLIAETRINDQTLCDDVSDDGFEEFDLAGIQNIIQNGLTGVTVELYESRSDRDNRTNMMDTTQPYVNRVNPQNIFVRVYDSTCEEEDAFVLNVAPYFEAPPIPDLTYCDEDQDLRTTLDLSRFDVDINAIVPGSSVRYFTNAADAAAGTNSIPTFDNTADNFGLFAEITNRDGCTDWGAFNIQMLPAPVINNPSPILLCDDNQDGFMTIDLTGSLPQILTNGNQRATFHTSESDAVSGRNPISEPTRYFTRTRTVHVRVSDRTTGCPSFTELPISINTTLPIITRPDFIACEDDGDDVGEFIFSELDGSILGNSSNKTISYHLNSADASSNRNAIDKNVIFRNTRSPQTIYYHVRNNSLPLCPSVGNFTIRVEDSPVYNIPSDVELCDDDFDGLLTFDLLPVSQQILSGNVQFLAVSYHRSEADALTGSLILGSTVANITNPETIYARISTPQGCTAVEPFTIGVIERPQTFPVNASYVCLDNDTLSSGFFNLTEREDEIIGTRNFNSVVSWHIDESGANDGSNAISGSEVTNFEIFDDTTVYLRLFNTVSGCYDIQPLELILNLTPYLLENETIEFCETSDGFIDLNQVIAEIFVDEGQNVEFKFYESHLDARSDINPVFVRYDYVNGLHYTLP